MSKKKGWSYIYATSDELAIDNPSGLQHKCGWGFLSAKKTTVEDIVRLHTECLRRESPKK